MIVTFNMPAPDHVRLAVNAFAKSIGKDLTVSFGRSQYVGKVLDVKVKDGGKYAEITMDTTFEGLTQEV